MKKGFLIHLFALFFYLSSGYGVYAAHINPANPFNPASRNLHKKVTSCAAQHDHVPVIKPSSKSGKENENQNLPDIEAPGEERILVKKYLESSNYFPVFFEGLIPPDFFSVTPPGFPAGNHFSHFYSFTCLYLLFRLIRI